MFGTMSMPTAVIRRALAPESLALGSETQLPSALLCAWPSASAFPGGSGRHGKGWIDERVNGKGEWG